MQVAGPEVFSHKGSVIVIRVHAPEVGSTNLLTSVHNLHLQLANDATF